MNESANEIINRLIRHIEKETCMHEETHRAGIIWEICDSCGSKWADDEGGKPEFEWPDCLLDAYKFIDEQKDIKNNQRESEPMNESACQVIAELYPKYGIDMWKHVQWFRCSDKTWIQCVSDRSIKLYNDTEYRVKPRTHIVNGIECPAPMSEKPAMGSIYFVVDLSYPGLIGRTPWSGSNYDEHRFKVGIFHTQEDALANFYAHYPHMKGV